MVFYKKKGFPKVKDIVLCKVKKILPHSVFAEIVEYTGKEGMIHISEISNRWTKNIQDIVNVGKMIVCRVERVNTDKGYIDLSKKRVTSGEEKKKKDEVKNENRVEKLIEYACKKNKISLKDFYDKTGFEIIKEYDSLFNFYDSFKEDESVLDDLELDKNIKDDIRSAFKSLVQKSRATVKKDIKFFAKGSDGLKDLKEFVSELLKLSDGTDNTLDIVYINSPEYLITVNSKNYKEANNFIDSVIKKMNELSKKYNISVLE